MLFENNAESLYFKHSFRTVNDILLYQKKHYPDKMAYRYVLSDVKAQTISYAELYDKVESLSRKIKQYTAPYDRVILAAGPGLEFIIGFYACLLARTIAVPIIPPATANMATRFVHILKDATPTLILFDKRTNHNLYVAEKADALAPKKLKQFLGVHQAHSEFFSIINHQKIPTLAIFKSYKAEEDTTPYSDAKTNDVAFIQYTSGSTGHPKGVMITHHNLLHNMEIIRKVVNHSEHSHVFSWLPPYHDMGLIAGIIEPLYSGITATLMSTLDFIEKPSRWVEQMAKYQCTTTGGPNFAFELCALKTSDDVVKRLDLSALEVVANGAEPLHWPAMELFYKKFAPAGLRKGVILPCYGLAESTVMVSGKTYLTSECLLFVDAKQLAKHKIRLVEQTDNARVLVSSGIPQLQIKIVHQENLTECAPDEVGEIWIHGDSVAPGYYNNVLETEKTFHAQLAGDTSRTRYLRSGDLGFVYRGELFVCGRIKNMIIIRGQNYYPQDIEYAVSAAHQAIRKGCVVAYANECAGQEALVVVAEIRPETSKNAFGTIIDAIKREISLHLQLSAHEIILLPPKIIPKTSSGKLQRIKCQELIENKQITPLYHYVIEDTLVESILVDDDVAQTNTTWFAQFEQANVSTRKQLLKDLILTTTAKTLAIRDVTSIDPDKGFFDLGLDSMKAVEIKTQLQKQLPANVQLDNTLIFNFSNINALINHLFHELSPSKNKKHKTAKDKTSRVGDEDIAIIGMSCNFPGASDIEEFWQLLVEGREGITEVPASRWDKKKYYSPDPNTPGKMICTKGGFIAEMDAFDAQFFSISPKELEYLDPQQRLLLMSTWTALEQANLNPMHLRGSNTGVFIGISSHDYETLILKNHSEQTINPYWSTGNAASTATGRLSFYFGFEGPNMAIETACSSSLVALHEACKSLQRAECNLAVVGGVNAILSPDLSIAFSKAGMLAPDGRCKTFDAKADGYVRGEGCGIVLLKRLSEAQRDKNTILAVIKASGINQDGASSGLTVPNGKAQEKLLKLVLDEAKLTPTAIDYIECHGTGTSLGDPVEVHAINRVYGHDRASDSVLKLGSVKTNIGHLEAASGMAGLIKTVLALQHAILPKNLHFQQLNPHITLHPQTDIVTHTQTWVAHRNAPRHAAISAFGFSGTNAHVILEEYKEAEVMEKGMPLPREWGFVLSAKSKRSLENLVQRYIHYLEATPDNLADICYTAATGRAHFKYRISILVKTKIDLLQQLKSAAFEITDLPLLDELISDSNRDILLQGFRAGKYVDWHAYYKSYAVRKVNLPTYCFDKQHYWLDIKNKKPASNTTTVHALLGELQIGHANETRFINRLSPSELVYLQDHRVFGQVLFPGAGFIESALASGVFVFGEKPIRLLDISLQMPLIVDGAKDYEVSIWPGVNSLYNGTIYAKQQDSPEWMQLADFKAEILSKSPSDISDIAGLKASLRRINVGGVYERFKHLGLDYGPYFQTIQEAYVGHKKALVAIKNDTVNTRGYYFHPSLLDGVFQAVGLALDEEPGITYIPASITSMNWYQKAKGLLWADVSIRYQDSHSIKADIKISNENGLLLAEIKGMLARSTTQASMGHLLLAKNTPEQYVEDYEPVSLPITQSTQQAHLIVIDDTAEDLTQQHVVFVYQGQFDLLLAFAKKVLNNPPLSFTLLTRNAVVIEASDKINPLHTQAVGFWKSFRLEAGSLPCYWIDSLDEESAQPILELISEHALTEPQVILRGHMTYVPRLFSRKAYAKRHHRLLPPEPQMYLTGGVGIDTIHWAERRLEALAENELKIQIDATALNFRDVLKAMNLYPGDAGDFGYECAGEVVELGRNVRKFKIGDKVIAIGQGLCGGMAVVNQQQVALLPKGLTSIQGASIPIVFLTANHALNQLAHIKKGQRILIHAASGGVGIAAIAFARLRGVEVFATASSAKQGYLKNTLGISMVYDSRSVEFSKHILRDTDGLGVDVVLNSLTGEGFIAASLACLRKGGVFVEIAKLNIYTKEQMHALRPDVVYHQMALDTRLQQEPTSIQKELQSILALFEKGQLTPLPITEYPVSKAADALHYMQQTKHIGKVVLYNPGVYRYNAKASYLITGGTGGLGLALAKHMLGQGAKRLVLISRGKLSSETAKWIEQQQDMGNYITHHSVDVADKSALKRVFSAIAKSGFPLKGIFHAAGALHDGMLLNLNKEAFDTVFATKISGSNNLDALSRDLALDFFVLFSSMTSLLGNPGQSNYTAANAYMDGLAMSRHQQNLPALSINWGPFSGVGMASELVSTHQENGVSPLNAQNAFAILDGLLNIPEAQVAVMAVDWSKVVLQGHPYLGHVGVTTSINNGEWVTLLQGVPKAHREAFLTDKIAALVADILNVSEQNHIDIHQNFFELGMDSIMAMELKNILQQMLGSSIMLHATFLFDNPSIHHVVGYLLAKLVIPEPAAVGVSTKEPMQELLPNQQTETKPATPQRIPNSTSIADRNYIYLPGGQHAVMLLYGLNGSPLEVLELAKSLNEAGYSVEIPRIEGYHFDAKNKIFTRYESWVREAMGVFYSMKSRYKSVALCGLCTGAVISLRLAELLGNEVSALLLLSTSLYMDGWNTDWRRSLIPVIYYSPWRYKLSLHETEPYGIKNLERRAYSAKLMSEKSISIAGGAKISFYDIYQARLLNKTVVKDLSLITCPTLVMHAKDDDVASLRNLELIARTVSSAVLEQTVLYDSYHVITVDNEKQLVMDSCRVFLDRNSR